jgi:hypothetical protein
LSTLPHCTTKADQFTLNTCIPTRIPTSTSSITFYLQYFTSITTYKMDFVNKLAGGNSNQQTNEQPVQGSSSGEQQSGGFLGGIGNKLNAAAGGGKESEKNEDYLDKGELHFGRFTSARVTNISRCRLRPGEVPGSGSPRQRGMSSLQMLLHHIVQS